MTSIIALRYHEIAIKKGNRAWFEERLATNAVKMVERALATDPQLADSTTKKIYFTKTHGRIFIHAPWNERIASSLARTFGISNFSLVKAAPTDLQALSELAYEEFLKAAREMTPPPRTFRVQTRRSDKALPQPSAEIDRIIGSYLGRKYCTENDEPSSLKDSKQGRHLTVDLSEPDVTVSIEIRAGQSYVWTSKSRGPGGLPVGSNGQVLALLSGGIDSPVAAIQMLKRGVAVSMVHFYGTPFVGTDALRKVQSLAAQVNAYQPDPKYLYIVPFGHLQEKVAQKVNPKIRTILYRRIMLKIANRLAKKIHARAIVTGESLGQVASQTLINLSAIDQASERPILRPLISLDKDEIITLAQTYKTYETSILPAIDCCTLFADRSPMIAVEKLTLEMEEAKIETDLSTWIGEVLKGTERIKLI